MRPEQRPLSPARSLLRTLLLAQALLPLAACGGGGGGSPSEPPRAAIVSLSLAPDPMPSRPCGGCGPLVGELETTTMATLRESGGVAARVTGFVVAVRSASGAVIAGPGDRPAVRDTVGASGSTTITFDTHFPGGPGGANLPATLRVEVQLLDARGNTTTVTREATILAP